MTGQKPPIVNWLGYGGLVPFILLAVLTLTDPEREALWHADLRAYAAVILSFVGAVHWGFATVLGSLSRDHRNSIYTWSVGPALIAFLSLIVVPVVGDCLLCAGFAVQYWRDVRVSRSTDLPGWYIPLRLRLSAIAIVSVAAGSHAVR